MNTNTTTLYIDYLLTILTDKLSFYPAIRWAEREMDDELNAQGYLNCGLCPYDNACVLNHRGDCAVGKV